MTLINPNDEWRVGRELTTATTIDHDIIKPSDPHGCHREYDCPVCDGGLAICKRCGKAEVELDEPCVPRDLGGIHDSDTCHLGPNDTPCDMCVAADGYKRRRLSDSVQAEFDALWSRTPLVVQESAERHICEYFYRLGHLDGRRAVVEVANDDLQEALRAARERLA